MKKILSLLATPSLNLTFHVFALGFMITGMIIAYTSREMGAVAPLLISGGIYLAFLGICIEGLFWFRHAVAWIASRLQGKCENEIS